MLPAEPLILLARQGFPDAQADLEGPTVEALTSYYSCGWYGTALSDEIGSFGIVNADGPLKGYVGDILRIRCGNRSVLAYVVLGASLPFDVGITRRCFAALSLLATDTIQVLIETVE